MPELQLQIVEFARKQGRVTIGGAIKLTGPAATRSSNISGHSSNAAR